MTGNISRRILIYSSIIDLRHVHLQTAINFYTKINHIRICIHTKINHSKYFEKHTMKITENHVFTIMIFHFEQYLSFNICIVLSFFYMWKFNNSNFWRIELGS